MQERNIAQHPALLQVPLGRDPAGRRVSHRHGAGGSNWIELDRTVGSLTGTGAAVNGPMNELMRYVGVFHHKYTTTTAYNSTALILLHARTTQE